MEQFGGPAALGGVVTGLMLGAWMFGRWQSLVGTGEGSNGAAPEATPLRPLAEQACGERTADAAARQCQVAARAERRVVLENAVAIAQLHEDVSAYRRAQQVLSDAGFRHLPVGWSSSRADQACRYLGVSGEPTCPMPASATMLCTCGTCSTPRKGGVEAIVVQPSAEPVAFTRV